MDINKLYKASLNKAHEGNLEESLKLAEQLFTYDIFNQRFNKLYADVAWRLSLDNWDKYYKEALRLSDAPLILVFDYVQKLIQSGHLSSALSYLDKFDSEDKIPQFCVMKGHIAYEQNDVSAASRYLGRANQLGMDNITTQRIWLKVLLKQGNFLDAIKIGERITSSKNTTQGDWAALTTTYKLAGKNELYTRLCDYSRFVHVSDKAVKAGGKNFGLVDELRQLLEKTHNSLQAPVEQSVRNGTQTDGQLFDTNNSVIKELSSYVMHETKKHLSKLPYENQHPLLSNKSRHFRYTGSWSVKLNNKGFHRNHFHNDGLISGCFYIANPAAVNSFGQGWLKLGEDEMGLGTQPDLFVKPQPGRLVLFPSYLWHGTVPFKSDEQRLTVAFDIAPAL